MRRGLLFAAAAAAVWLTGSAHALDSRYSDADNDMVADAPADPKLFVDPATLIFAYTPVEDPEVYRKVWDDFLAHLSKTTGKKVLFFPGAVQCSADRGDAGGAAACGGVQYRVEPAGGELRRVCAVCDDGEPEERVRL